MAGREKINEEMAFGLWNDGMLDNKIAKELGCAVGSIGRWRRKNEYPSNVDIFNWDSKGYVDNDKRGYVKYAAN